MIKFNEVTGFSKLAAIIFFIGILPILAFYIGTQYQEVQESQVVVLQPSTVLPKKNIEQQKDVVVSAKEVLTALKNKDYDALEKLSSSAGISINEYPSLDFSKADIIKEDISNIPADNTIRLFGYTDGKGDPINLTTASYIDKWIYNHDYINAPEIAIDKAIDGGTNSISTILKDAEGRKVVGFHFKGFDEKYGGMDWTTLYIIFDLENGEYKLRGMVKNNWTI